MPLLLTVTVGEPVSVPYPPPTFKVNVPLLMTVAPV